jgi:cytochrome c-type biogenesis protein CcsB
MMSSQFLGITTFVYFFIMIFYFCYLFFRSDKFNKLTYWLIPVGFLAHTAGLGLRWAESYELGYGHIPLSNLYETLVSLSWSVVLIFFLIEWKYRTKILGALVFPLVSISMAYASLSPDIQSEIEPLIPALQSNWLTYHVITCFFGYAAFAVSFGSSIVYLIKGRSEEAGSPSIVPASSLLDEINYRCNAIGFLLLSIGIITGAVWAEVAWGSYWSWDPKETWSLITWFVYAAFLHARLTRGWRGKRTAILSIFGFLCVIFTFLGVNYLLSGLHSYA